jgi:hypothetical protein
VSGQALAAPAAGWKPALQKCARPDGSWIRAVPIAFHETGQVSAIGIRSAVSDDPSGFIHINGGPGSDFVAHLGDFI